MTYNYRTSAQQGAAPDRPQCRRFFSFVARLKLGRDWRAAGELSVVLLRPLGCVRQAVLWPLILRGVKSKLAASALSAGAAWLLWRGVWVRVAETNQQQHNKALHPTARSVVVFPALRLGS